MKETLLEQTHPRPKNSCQNRQTPTISEQSRRWNDRQIEAEKNQSTEDSEHSKEQRLLDANICFIKI